MLENKVKNVQCDKNHISHNVSRFCNNPKINCFQKSLIHAIQMLLWVALSAMWTCQDEVPSINTFYTFQLPKDI